MAKAKEEPKVEETKVEAKVNEIVPVAATGLSVAPVMDMEADEGAGLGNIGVREMLIPYFSIIQSTSKVLDETEANFIKGAKASDFLNTATGKLYDGKSGVTMIFCDFTTRYTEWTPVDKGGGFVADHGTDDSILATTTKDDKGRDMTPRGTQIVKSADYPAIIIDEDTGVLTRVLVSMTSTQLKKSRRLNTIANEIQLPRKDGKGTYTPPLYYMSYKITTVQEKNEQGRWFGYKIEPYKPLPELFDDVQECTIVYNAAKSFSAQMRSGAVKADQSTAKPDSEIPF